MQQDRWTADHPTPFRIGPRALLAIFGFWTIFAIASVAYEIVSPFGVPRPFRSEIVALSFLGAYLWAAITPVALWFISRYSLEAGHLAVRIPLYLVLAVALAVLVSFILALIGNQLLDPARVIEDAASPGPPRQRPFRSWLLVLVRFRFLSDLMASMLVLAGGHGYSYFRRFQARQAEATLLREQLTEARLQVLRTQLNPHFLFNTLNAVAGLVATDPGGVRRMIARLSDVLRYSLNGGHEPEVRLERELDILRRYLEILEIRYQGRLVTEVSAEPEVLDVLVPTLILQPLAENAMTHGVARAGGRGRIEVHARRDGDDLVLTVRDTGGGPDEPIAEPDRIGGGIGLSHSRQRLEQLYGSAYRLELRPHPERGMVSEITLPFHTAGPRAGRREGGHE